MKFKLAFLYIMTLLMLLWSAPLFGRECLKLTRKWGQDISTIIKEMHLLEHDDSLGGAEVYIRPSDRLEIGPTKLQSIKYYFWQRKFMMVILECQGLPDFQFLKEAAFARFGPGFKPNQFIERYAWIGNKTGIILEYNEITQKGTMTWMSIKMMKRLQSWLKEKAKEAAKKGW